MTGATFPIPAFLAIMLVTWLTRALPYLVFGGKRKVPPMVEYLGAVLPPAIMMILVLYCLRGTPFTSFPFGIPQFLSIVLTILVQLWKKNAFLSSFVGTVCYMILIRTLFLT